MRDFFVLIVAVVLLSSCNSLKSDWDRWVGKIQKLQLNRNVTHKPTAPLWEKIQIDPVKGKPPIQLIRGYQELIGEMIRVVFRDPADFSSKAVLSVEPYLQLIEQGATLEGIYNGFTHGERYRDKEANSGAVSPAALKLFVSEMVWFKKKILSAPYSDWNISQNGAAEIQLKFDPHHWVLGDAKPMQPFSVTGFGQLNPVSEVGPISPREQSIEDLEKIFLGASSYTLKRLWSDEWIRFFGVFLQEPKLLAQFYSTWVSRVSNYRVDFGLDLRNSSDQDFHRNWAERVLQEQSQDRLLWECLNRIHRLINDTDQQK